MNNEKTKYFEILQKIDVSGKVDKKNKFNYLSWAYAVEEMTKACPDWVYEIEHFNNLPYIYDEKTGYMVFTNITAFGSKKRMWLPVMDNKNAAKKSADMMDINKTIMRCLVKNIAMFGLGLAVYAGEDLPQNNTIHIDKEKFFENSKEHLLSANNVDELKKIFTSIYHLKHQLSPEQYNELDTIKNNMKDSFNDNNL